MYVSLHGDFGMSFVRGRPVGELIMERLPSTAQLAVAALLFSALVFPATTLDESREANPFGEDIQSTHQRLCRRADERARLPRALGELKELVRRRPMYLRD